MLNELIVRNFTIVPDARLGFGKNLNIIVGENGTGKSHLLKAAYSAIAVTAAHGKNGTDTLPRPQLQAALANKLQGVFRPDGLWRLVRRGQGRRQAHLKYTFEDPALDLAFTFSTVARTEVKLSRSPKKRQDKLPVFFPTRELLTIAPGFVSLYETTHLPFEETWRDTCLLLEAPLAKGPRESRIKELLVPLEKAMGGKVVVDSRGRFYLRLPSGNMEMHLVAEGLRKLAMVARLIATGSLLDKGYLFWDEPETNLNPRMIRTVARAIMQIANNGVQVFVATHSLFLLRELYILQQRDFQHFDTRCIGLHLQGDASVEIKQGATIDEIGEIAALDEDLAQSDRYIETELASGR